MVLAIYLIMIATPLQSSQLAIMLEDNGLGLAATAWIISVFSISTIVGRIVCGLALDKFPTPIVSSVCTLPPALGFFLLAHAGPGICINHIGVFYSFCGVG